MRSFIVAEHVLHTRLYLRTLLNYMPQSVCSRPLLAWWCHSYIIKTKKNIRINFFRVTGFSVFLFLIGPFPPTRYLGIFPLFVQGRNGLGSIYVWAVGNGRSNDDSCATDGYASSIYTIAVGSVNQWGQRAYYDEACSARMAVTFNYNKSSRTRTHTQVVHN